MRFATGPADMGGGHGKAPRGWAADAGQAGKSLIANDKPAFNAMALRLARLRLMGLGGAVAALEAGVTDARALTVALGGRWHGSYGTAPCPLCQPDRRRDQNALTLADGGAGLLAHCKPSGCGFRDILAAAGIAPGSFSPPDPMMHTRREAERRAEAMKRAALAERLWGEAQPINGTPAEAYLRGRSITCLLPETLRYHPACWHGPTATRGPAMLALVEGGGASAVHRTWLRPDGGGKAGLTGGDKLILGATAGGAVRLSRGASRLVVGEGLEGSLSLLCGLLEGPASVWAGLLHFSTPVTAGILMMFCGKERRHDACPIHRNPF
jgi:hypothetical protein